MLIVAICPKCKAPLLDDGTCPRCSKEASGRRNVRLPVEEVEAKKAKGEKLTRKENFQLLARKAAKAYYENNKWSSLELKYKAFFEKMGLVVADWSEREKYKGKKVHIWHNYPLKNPGHPSKPFEIDFLVVETRDTLPAGIEVSPAIWHSLGNTPQKDKRKLEAMEKAGIRPYVLEGDPEDCIKKESILYNLLGLVKERIQ
jgi:uncharacterized Zn finger protein (UPF0148 family)